MSQRKDYLIHKVSNYSESQYGELLIECMNRFNCSNTQELTVEMLEKFIEDRGIKDIQDYKTRN